MPDDGHIDERYWLGLSSDLPDSTRQMLDAITMPAYVHRAGRVLHANQPMLRLVGHAQEDMLQLHHSELATDDLRDPLKVYGESCVSRDEEPPAMELTLRHAQGHARPVEINARRVMQEGLPTVIVTCQDLSDIQHVQSSMLNLSQVLHQIINGGPLAAFVIDKDQCVTHWNRACQRLTGVAPMAMLGSTEKWRAFYPEERPVLADLIVSGTQPERLLELFGGAIRPSDLIPDAWEGESFVPSLGGDGRWLYFNAAPLRDASGEIVGAVQTMQDVTQRRLAEQELLRHRNQLEQIVEERSKELRATVHQLAAFMENSPIGIVHMVEGVVMHHNRIIADMFGVDGSSLAGLRGADFFHSREDYSDLVARAVPCLEQGEPLQHELWMRHQSGTPLWVQVIAYAADVRDIKAGTWWLVQDRTEFRRTQDELHSNFERIKETNQKLEDAQNQLLQQDKMASIGQLAAGVAHEINNPIGFVGSNLHSLRNHVNGMLELITAYEGAEAQGLTSETRPLLERVKQKVEIDYLRED
ncbi:PAS domain S-box protein, partial [Ideonella sp.]|uniref:PAS domain S-box protein n=1 Tax=Ideonella sp. TaxID=1929293 RepID=UPI003BB4EC24